MPKHIAKWSYWLGIACLAAAIILRIANAVGIPSSPSLAEGRSFGYLTFYRGGLLFFAATLASAAYDWLGNRVNAAKPTS